MNLNMESFALALCAAAVAAICLHCMATPAVVYIDRCSKHDIGLGHNSFPLFRMSSSGVQMKAILRVGDVYERVEAVLDTSTRMSHLPLSIASKLGAKYHQHLYQADGETKRFLVQINVSLPSAPEVALMMAMAASADHAVVIGLDYMEAVGLRCNFGLMACDSRGEAKFGAVTLQEVIQDANNALRNSKEVPRIKEEDFERLPVDAQDAGQVDPPVKIGGEYFFEFY